MSERSWWDEPVSGEIVFTTATRGELLARLMTLTKAELAAAVVRVEGKLMPAAAAIPWLREQATAEERLPSPGEEAPTSSAVGPESSEWRPLLRLTERQMAIVRGVARGLTNREIADELELAPDTVKAHLAAVLKKVDAVDRVQLAYRYAQLEEAHRLGLTPRSALQGRSTAARGITRRRTRSA